MIFREWSYSHYNHHKGKEKKSLGIIFLIKVQCVFIYIRGLPEQGRGNIEKILSLCNEALEIQPPPLQLENIEVGHC